MDIRRWTRAHPKRAIVLGLAWLVACGGTASPSPAATAPASSPPAVSPSPAGPSPTRDDLDRIMAFAAGDADPAGSELGRLWAAAFAELEVEGADPYVQPADVRSYRAGEVPPTECTASQSAARWRNNALWCPTDDVIAYDADWFRDLGARFSYIAPVAVVAHEWGHHVQSIVGRPAKAIERELQADCFSGLYLAATDLLGDREQDAELRTEAMAQAITNWFEQGDSFYPDTEWTDPSLHGSPQQRIMSTITGMLSYVGYGQADASVVPGIPWCLGYADFRGSEYAEIGPYALLVPPGRGASWQSGTFALPADVRTSLETSDITLTWLPNLPQPAGAPLADQLVAIWGLAFPELTPQVEIDISANAPYDASSAVYFDNDAAQSDGTTLEQSGLMALLAPPGDSGGLLIIVSRGVPAATGTSPPELAQLEEHLNGMFQVLNRLCSPGESDEIGAENLDVACLRDLQ